MSKPNMQEYLLHTDKVITPKDYADALAVQSAVNLCVVAHSFATLLKNLYAEDEGGEWAAHHPTVRLFMEQMAFLAGGFVSDDNYATAHKVCEARSVKASAIR